MEQVQPIKVSIIGAGGTGGQIAAALAQRTNNVHVVLMDVREGEAAGKALDIWQSSALLGTDITVSSTTDLKETAHSHVVVITAGEGRRPGLQREQLFAVNATIISEVARQTALLSPNAFIIVLTNPADLLTRAAWEKSGFPSSRVIGQGGVLDSARMRTFIASTLGVSTKDVRCMVLGGHGDSMVPVKEFASVNGVPVQHLMEDADWQAIVRRTCFGGGEILEQFKTHGAAVTPGWAVIEMIDALLSNVPRLLPISTRAEGAYGLNQNVFIGLPALLSNRGVERVVTLPMAEEEVNALKHSAKILESTWDKWKSSQMDGA